MPTILNVEVGSIVIRFPVEVLTTETIDAIEKKVRTEAADRMREYILKGEFTVITMAFDNGNR
jgi:hypothetical protein